MCTMTHLFLPANHIDRKAHAMHIPRLPELPITQISPPAPLFRVIPAGNAFFHIQETATGRVRGFREDHNEACALARSLEARIELLS